MSEQVTWGDPVEPPQGEFQKWINPGDEVAGKVLKIEEATDATGSKVVPQLHFQQPDGSVKIVTAAQARLLRRVQQLLADGFEAGHLLKIVYNGEVAVNGRRVKDFTVTPGRVVSFAEMAGE
jgi:hypothetical protein